VSRRTVLFVCHANTCRSVMAHVLLEKMLAERRADHGVQVRSGGVGNIARDGMIPSLDARIVLREDGIMLGEDTFTSTDLRRHHHLIGEADLILTMTDEQKHTLATISETPRGRVFTLREFAGDGGDIKDPFGQDENRYRMCRDEIKRCLEQSMDRLLDHLDVPASTRRAS
jgi:protein arginine phosphatase